jgi:23S rRNA pseudouridine1911/1915/1917 synthase
LNHGYDYAEVLGPQAEGWRLLDWLISRYPHSSADAWRERIEEGRVLLHDRTALAGDVLRRGHRPRAARHSAAVLEEN